MTAITDNGFARVTKETIVRNPSTPGALTSNDISYSPTETIKEKIDSLVIGGGGGVTVHSALTGLSADDHTQYSKADGTRAFTGKVSYNSHPTFTTDTEIVDKKYVDDATTTKANLAGATFTGDINVPDEVYGPAWNGSTEVPTKNAVFDKVEAIVASGVGDGDKGDINVTGGGTVWTIDNGVLTPPKASAEISSTFSTSLLTGGAITSASSSTVNIAAAELVFYDNHTNPLSPVYTRVSFAGATGITPAFLATNSVTYFCVDKLGALKQYATLPVRGALRDEVTLGSAIHLDGATILAIDNFTSGPSLNTALNFDDVIEAMGGILNPEGNNYSRGTTNALGLNKSAGRVFWSGANYKNGAAGRKDPNNLTTGAQADLSFIYIWRDGSGGFNTSAVPVTSVTPGRYDDGTGGATQPNGTVANNEYVNHRIYYDATTQLSVIQFGQVKYGSMDAAIAAQAKESFIKAPEVTGLMFRGWVTIKGNATDLGNSAQAVFTAGGIFQDSAGGALSSSLTNLQAAYNNSSVNPEILTDSVRGALGLRRGSAADTDTVLEIQNGAGTVTSSIKGDGTVEATGFIKNGVLVPNISEAATLTTKTIALGSNTISGTKAQFNTAVTDGDFVYSGDVATSLNMGTAKILGRTTAGSGAVEEITVGSGLSLAGGTLSASGGGGGGGYMKLQDVSGASVIGILGSFDASAVGTLQEVAIISDTLPVGSNIIAELRKNSTTSGNVLSTTLQITTAHTATNGVYRASVTGFTSSAIASGDIFYLYLTSVGSTTPGLNVRATLRFS